MAVFAAVSSTVMAEAALRRVARAKHFISTN